MTNATRIVVIAKAPSPGFAKTRLIPALGAAGAARLAERMLHHTLASALAAQLGPVELCAAPDPGDPAWLATRLPHGVSWSAQGTGDLGARMARAAQRTCAGGEPVLLIGTDCPGLSAAHLQQAAAALTTHAATLVPTWDGGYALLGLRQAPASLFQAMPWSTPAVASETLRRTAQLGWQVKLWPTLHDIDEPADLQWLPPDWQDGHQALAHAR